MVVCSELLARKTVYLHSTPKHHGVSHVQTNPLRIPSFPTGSRTAQTHLGMVLNRHTVTGGSCVQLHLAIWGPDRSQSQAD